MDGELRAATAPARRPARRWHPAMVVIGAAAAVALVLWLGFDRTVWGDWTAEARPSVDALLHDRFGAFLREAPAYGGSLLLRAPFFELTRLWHGGGQAIYRAGAAPCLAALVALALWLSRQMAARGCGPWAQTVAVVLCIATPVSIPGLTLGHPEELLGAVLCVAAVLCAQRDRAVWSGVLVGLAIANKPWGVLAAGPVLVALSRDRGRALAALTATAAALLAPFMLVRSGGVVGQAAAAGAGSGSLFSPWQLWWFLGRHVVGVPSSVRFAPAWLGGLGHTLPVAIMPPITLAYAWHARRSRRRGHDALLLLALLLMLRCALDPWDIAYYAVPFATALLAWETGDHDGPPVIALIASATAWTVFEGTTYLFGDDRPVLAASFDAVVLVATATMAMRLFGARAAGARLPGTEQVPPASHAAADLQPV